MALVFTQPVTEMSTRSRKRIFLGSRAQPARKTGHHSHLENVGASMSHNPIGLPLIKHYATKTYWGLEYSSKFTLPRH
jgi:hypothetical protein